MAATSILDRINDRIKKVDGEALGRKIGEAIRKKAEEKLRGVDAKKAGEKLGKKVAEKIGKAIGLPQGRAKTPVRSKGGNPRKKERDQVVRAAGALSNAARRMGREGRGVPKTLTAAQRRDKAAVLAANRENRWI